jgi:hypothetical protein
MFWSCSQDLFFVHYVLNYLGLLNVASIKDLYSINLISFFIVACIDLPEITRTKLFDNVKVTQDHFLFMILFAGRLSQRFICLWIRFWLFGLKINWHFSCKSFALHNNILWNSELLMGHELAELNNWIWFISNALSFQMSSEIDVNNVFKLLVFLKDSLIFF